MKRLGNRGRLWGRRGVCRGEGEAERLGQDVCEGSKKAGGGVCAGGGAETLRLCGRRGAGPLEKHQGDPESEGGIVRGRVGEGSVSMVRPRAPAGNQQPPASVLAPRSFLMQRGECPISSEVFRLEAGLG